MISQKMRQGQEAPSMRRLFHNQIERMKPIRVNRFECRARIRVYKMIGRAGCPELRCPFPWRPTA